MADRRRTARSQDGSATVLVLGVAAVVLVVGGLTSDLGRTELARGRAGTAADLAALAAADAPRPGSGRCAEAGRVAEANRARLTSCSVTSTADGAVVTVVTAVRLRWATAVPGGPERTVAATARAGPAGAAAQPSISDRASGP